MNLKTEKTEKSDVIVKETSSFRLEASNHGIRIISKLTEPYKVLSLSYQDLTNLLVLLDSVSSEVVKRQTEAESSAFRPVPLVQRKD